MEGRSKRAPVLVHLEGSPLKFNVCGCNLILHDPAAFYVIDISQFDDPAAPAQLKAVKITRFGVVGSDRYGHRTDSMAHAATAKVVASPGAIYDVFKIDHRWWDEKDEGKGTKGEKKPVDYCEDSVLPPSR